LSDVRPDFAARVRPNQALLRRRLTRADALADLVRALHASLDPQRVASTLVGLAAEWLPAPGWLVAGCGHGGRPRVLAARGLIAEHEVVAREIAIAVMRSGRVFAAGAVGLDGRPATRAVTAVAAALGFPLEGRGRIVGALVALDPAPATRDPVLATATLAALNGALELAAVALDNALRMQHVESLSVTDDLTQLYNSRYLSQVLRRETKRASRSGRPLSLLFIDLDGFKSVNDRHGHLVGSRALVEAAAVIRASARETDVVARFGGDEFALILPETGTEGAAAVGERIRDTIAAHHFLQAEGLDVRLTVSVGVATLPDIAGSADGLLKAADEAMYRVKDYGKNGIHVAAG